MADRIAVQTPEEPAPASEVTTPAEPPSPDRLAAHLAEWYGIDVERFTRPEGHNPFVLRVRRRDGADWVARLFSPRRPRHRVEEEAEILRFLEEHDYPAERCADPEPVSDLDGWTVLVTVYAGENGQETRSVAIQLNTVPALATLGDMLGRLAALPLGSGAIARDGGAWHGDPNYEGLPANDIVAAKAMLDQFDKVVPPAARDPYDWLRARLDELDDSAGLPSSLVHPDFHWKNIVVAPDGGLVAVDWTGAGRGPRINPFANLLMAAHAAGSMAPDKVAAIVNGYRKHVEVEPEELDRMPMIIRIRDLYFACYYYRMGAATGYFANGGEGWWPTFETLDAIAGEARRAFTG